MSVEIRVPQLPESIADATLVAWHKQPGQAVTRDENLADLETDKVVLEVPAPTNGILRELKVPSGTTVTSGQVLALIEEGGAAATQPTAEATAAKATQAAGKPASSVAGNGSSAAAATGGAASARSADEDEAGAGKLSPAVRRLVEENGLNPADIPASGRDGRLTKSDVVDYLEKQKAGASGARSASELGEKTAMRASTPMSQPPATGSGQASSAFVGGQDGRTAGPAGDQGVGSRMTQPPTTGASNVASIAPKSAPAGAKPSAPAARTGRAEQRVAMTRLRQRIAQRMVEAQSSQALLTSFNEVDLTAVNELRAKYKDRFEKQHGVKLGFMSFFVKASIEALKKFPVVNATIDGTDIVYHEFYDIGVAVSTDRGLMVPIVRDADLKSFADIEKEIGVYATKAREGSIAIEDLTGGTFTITNGGVFGSLMSTPIVNAPQSAILGMHKIQERPMVVNGEIKIRPMMYLAVTYDHRLIDGREAVQFLVTVKESLEDPGRMLLGI
jgi:2-oxoglutarate dehydrogenase E2 component (dihydrolipoamide succinyltransferase)